MRLLASLMRRYGQKVMMVRKIGQLYAQERCCHFTSRDLMEIVRRGKRSKIITCVDVWAWRNVGGWSSMSHFRPGELCIKYVSVILVAFSRLFAHHSCMKKVIIRNVCAAL